MIDKPSEEEIMNTIKSLKKSKSSGKNGITGEFLQEGGELQKQKICNVLRQI